MRQSSPSQVGMNPRFLIPSVERHTPLIERFGAPEKSTSNRYSQ